MANRYNPRGLLSPLQSLNIGGGVDPLSNIDPLRGQSLMGQPVRMPAASPMALQLQQRMQPQQARGGGVLGGLGRAFTGEGSSARLSALGASLLQGPSRTPISLGSSLAQGLLAGNVAAQQEQERKFKRGLLEREMAVAEAKLKPKPTEAENVNIILPDGTTTYGKSDKLGNLTLPDGSKAPAGSRIFGTSITASKLGDIAPEDKKAREEFGELSINAQTFFNSGNKLLKGLEENKAAATVVGTISGVGSKVYQNVEEGLKALGVPSEKTQEFENIFEKNSIDSSKMKSQILDLAYQAAKIRGQEGRGLSDRDVKIFSEIIGSNKPAAEKAAVLRDYMDTIKREVELRANLINQSQGIDLTIPPLNIYTPEPVTPPPAMRGAEDGSSRQDKVKAALDRANQVQQTR
jgi:hypothetical protein